MAANVEIKARVKNLEHVRARAARLSSDTPVELLHQEDTFFVVQSGRLKLRTFTPGSGELIYYERADVAGPKPSHYCIYLTSHPDVLKAVLSAALGIRGIVRKQRWVYKVGQTRIHLDDVEGLGSFLELEVVLAAGQTAAEGTATAVALMQTLGIEETALIPGAYIDLLSAVGPSHTLKTRGHKT